MVRSRQRHRPARRVPSRFGLLPKDRRRRHDNRRRARRTNPKGGLAPAAAGGSPLAGGQSHRDRGCGDAGIVRVVSQKSGAHNPMDTDENKERTTPGEREEVRSTGSGGERTKGRASRPDRGSTRGTSGALAAATGAARGAARSLLRLTPAGDAARMWLPTAIAVLVVTFVFFVVGGSLRSVHWLLGINVLYGLILVLTWGAMWLSTPADVRRWALAQEPSHRSRWGRLVEVISDRRVFSGGAGMSFIISVSVGGLSLAVALLPRGEDLGAEPLRTLLCVLGVLLSWALLHTSYAMYYAHLYYRDPRKAGGMKFPGEGEPAAPDFAYFACSIGTTRATSDVSVSSGKVRRTVLVHGVLAFFYNTAILGLVVNLIVGSV